MAGDMALSVIGCDGAPNKHARELAAIFNYLQMLSGACQAVEGAPRQNESGVARASARTTPA
jgi:hypothetical protein